MATDHLLEACKVASTDVYVASYLLGKPVDECSEEEVGGGVSRQGARIMGYTHRWMGLSLPEQGGYAATLVCGQFL